MLLYMYFVVIFRSKRNFRRLLIIHERYGSPRLSPAAQEEPAGASTLESLPWDIGYDGRFGR